MTPEEFRRAGYAMIDWIAAYRESLRDQPVLAPAKPGQIKAMLPASPPQEPEGMEAILADFDAIARRGITNWQHPRFMAYFPANALLAGVLGDLASTGLGVIGLTWAASPALTELEEVMLDWMRQALGLPPAFSGVIQDTASTSTLVALTCARERASRYALARGGLHGEAKRLTVYTSAQAHSSVEKAALIADFGRENVRAVPVDASYAMRIDALESMIMEDVEAGCVPCAVVATTGTTTTTAIDPIEAIGRLAREHAMWLHVDGAMAGSAMILPECRWMWAGVEGADSIVINPHKWLGVPFDCSLYYVRDAGHLVRVMSTSPSYLQTNVDAQVKSLRDWGIPMGRRFRALKLWFVLREQGLAGLQTRLRRDLANAKRLETQVRGTKDWRVLAPIVLQTLCVRHEPDGLEGEPLDRHTLAWVERVNLSGAAYLTPALLDGRWMVRVSIGSLETEENDVAQVWQAMRDAAGGGG
jgi:aromatic-L-amino-acid decarboxylase